jgi:putative ABC transport system permease protein
MMKFNPLNKRLKREFKDNLGRYLAIAIMFISTIAIISAFLVVASSVKNVIENNKKINLIEDGQFTLNSELTDSAENSITSLGVRVYKNYYVDMEYGDKTTLRIYTNREEVNLAVIMEGKLPEASDEIAIDRLFAKSNEIYIGDRINGFEITGFVALADYSALFENNNDILLNTHYFGVGVVTREGFEALEKSKEVVYNYAYRSEKSDLSAKESYDLSNEIVTVLHEKGAEVTDLITSYNNQSISFVSNDMGSDVPMMKVLLYIILAIMAFVFAVLIKHTIESEAVIIGTLLASGYTKNEILLHYMSLPIIVTMTSALIGNILGYTVMIEPFKGLYYNSYSLPPCEISINLEALLLTTILPVLMIIVINYFTLRKQLSISPLRFLRRDLKKVTKSGAIRLPNFSFLTRFRIRVILQNKSSYAVLFIGIFMASFLLLFALCLIPVINHYVDTIDDTMLAKYQYILKAPIEAEKGAKTTFASLAVYNKSADKDMEVSFYGIDKLDSYSLNSKDIYFSNSLLKKLGTTTEEKMRFFNKYSEKSYIVKGTEEINYTAGFAVIMSRERLNEILGYPTDYFNGYLSDERLDIDEAFVAKIITAEDMTKLGEQMMSSFGGIIAPIVSAAVMIYLVLMYILTKLAIEKNALCISFMKVFGYEDKQIRKVYLHAGTFTVIASLIICLPLEGIAAKASILAAMNKTSGYIEPYIPKHIYLIIVAVGLASYFIINTFHVIRVSKIDMVEALKNQE